MPYWEAVWVQKRMAKWALCFGYFSFLPFDTAFLGFFRVGRLQITDTFEVANFSIFGNLHIRNFCVPNTRIFESPFRIHNSLMISRLQDVEIMSIFVDPDSLPLLTINVASQCLHFSFCNIFHFIHGSSKPTSTSLALLSHRFIV